MCCSRKRQDRACVEAPVEHVKWEVQCTKIFTPYLYLDREKKSEREPCAWPQSTAITAFPFLWNTIFILCFVNTTHKPGHIQSLWMAQCALCLTMLTDSNLLSPVPNLAQPVRD